MSLYYDRRDAPATLRILRLNSFASGEPPMAALDPRRLICKAVQKKYAAQQRWIPRLTVQFGAMTM